MNLRNFITLATGLLLLSSHGFSIASPDYVSFSVGQATFDTGVTGLTGSASLDEEDSSFKLMMGANISPLFAIEGFFLDYGEAALTGNSGDQFIIDGTVLSFIVNNARIASSATAIGASVLFLHDLNTDLSLYAELGVARWDSDFTVSGAGIGSSALSETGTDSYFGFGIRFSVNAQISLAADYEVHEVDDDGVDLFSVYLIYGLQ